MYRANRSKLKKDWKRKMKTVRMNAKREERKEGRKWWTG